MHSIYELYKHFLNFFLSLSFVIIQNVYIIHHKPSRILIHIDFFFF